MVQCAYNLQEALSPLLQRFGWHLQGDRSEGLQKMVAAIGEALEIDEDKARHLVASLASCGLLDFEQSRPAQQVDPPGHKTQPVSYTSDTSAIPAGDKGVWRIGPCL